MSPVRNELEFPGLSPAASLATGNPAQSGCTEAAASSKEPVPRDPPEPSSTQPRAEGSPRPHRRTKPPLRRRRSAAARLRAASVALGESQSLASGASDAIASRPCLPEANRQAPPWGCLLAPANQGQPRREICAEAAEDRKRRRLHAPSEPVVSGARRSWRRRRPPPPPPPGWLRCLALQRRRGSSCCRPHRRPRRLLQGPPRLPRRPVSGSAWRTSARKRRPCAGEAATGGTLRGAARRDRGRGRPSPPLVSLPGS